jgi:hypothetical protein
VVSLFDIVVALNPFWQQLDAQEADASASIQLTTYKGKIT